jgi:N-methylhydantoinase A
MAARIGVDVGGTFTKAVAFDPEVSGIVARAIVPTTHASSSGVADGAVEVIATVADEVARLQRGPVDLVAHSTTQAVNSLLEGDTATVGVLGMGRRPDLKRARKRTQVGDIRLAPGRRLSTHHRFLDISGGIEEVAVRHAVHELVEEGAEVIAASEAFGVEDARGEWLALKIAADMGVPACAGHELTGLYGLEMRTVTAALNGSILATALKTARLVQEAADRKTPGVPLLVMRGDGGVVNLEVMKRHPLLTAFSGPAASVAGALQSVHISDAVVIEVGGTSTNVAVIKNGRPVLSYVRVLDHVTCVRSLDVRVVGVAGGSLLRVAKRIGGLKVADVGPRSAHIAGLPYACFETSDEVEGSTARLVSPRTGDPADYLVLETARGRRIGLTLTCAANALGEVPPDSYASGSAEVARRAFAIAGKLVGMEGRMLARKMVETAVGKVAAVVGEGIAEHGLRDPLVVGLGGGAGAVVPAVARAFETAFEIPPDAEVISSIGDAQSAVRVEIERTLARPSAEEVARAHGDAEAAALRAGAAPGTIQLESLAVPERGALRVTAFGAVSLQSGPTEITADAARAEVTARAVLEGEPHLAFRNEFFFVYVAGSGDDRSFAVVDRTGAVAVEGRGKVISGTGAEVAAGLDERIPALVRHYGPVAVGPAVRVIRGPRLVDLTLMSNPDSAREAALGECALAHDEEVVALLTRD